MSRTDILDEIKSAEVEANAKVAKAEADKKASIADARKNAVTRIQEAEAEARSKSDSAIAKEKEALAAKRDALLGEGKKEASKIDESVDVKMQKVKDFLNEEFVRTLDVTS